MQLKKETDWNKMSWIIYVNFLKIYFKDKYSKKTNSMLKYWQRPQQWLKRVIIKDFQYLILLSKLSGSSLRANENGIVLEVNAFWWYVLK